jgi:hypothetical protein
VVIDADEQPEWPEVGRTKAYVIATQLFVSVSNGTLLPSREEFSDDTAREIYRKAVAFSVAVRTLARGRREA